MFTRKITLITTVLLISACSYFSSYGRYEIRGRRALANGDYDAAVAQAVLALETKPDYEDAISLLDTALPLALKYHSDRIRSLENSSEPFRWDTILEEYIKLDQILKDIDDLQQPSISRILDQTDYPDPSGGIAESKNNSAESHYQAGMEHLQTASRDSFRKAAVEFKYADNILPGYKDAEVQYIENRKKGTLVLAFLPFDDKTGRSGFGDVGETVTSRVISSLLSDRDLSEFVEIVRRDQIELVVEEQILSESGLIEAATLELGNILEAHQLVSCTITSLTVGKPRVLKNTKKMSESVVVRKESYTGEDGKKHSRNVYGTVKARVTFHELTASASATANFNIIDVETGKIIRSQTTTGQFKFQHDWATFTGDERALNHRTTSLVKKGRANPPEEGDLVYRALMDLSEKVTAGIRNSLH